MGIYDYNYTNLHCHSGLASLRDSLSKIDDLADRYVELGMKNLSLTDHGQITGIFQLFKECKRTGLKPLLGCELYVVDEADEGVGRKGEQRDHIIIYPKSYDYMPKFYGIISEANRNKFNGFGRISYQKLFDMDLSGLIISSACSIGFLKRHNYEEYALKFYEKLGNDFYLEIIPVKYNANKIANKYQEILNKKDKTNNDITFLESIPQECITIKHSKEYNKKTKKEKVISTIEIEGGRLANERAINLHKKYGIRLIACQDSHYTRKEDSTSHQVLLCQRSRKKMNDIDKWSFGEDNIYVKDIKEFRDSFIKLGYFDKEIIMKAILESNKIADMINLEMPEYYVNLPTPFPDRNDDEIMQEYIQKGWEKYKIDEKENRQIYIDRLNKEMSVFKEYALERYMIIMADIFDFIRKENIPHGPGRGSSSGSLVAYLMGITKINPIDNLLNRELYFERFLNSGRINKKIIDGKICIDSNSLPDIDSDCSKSQRYKIVSFIQKRYGHEYVSQISNYVYYTPKSAFKAVCSAYSIDFKTANKLTDYIEEGIYKDKNGNSIPYTELESLKYQPDLKKFFGKHPDYYNHVLNINGLVSSNGTHAAALIISDKPIQNIVPIDVRNNNEVACMNMKEIATLGLCKIDLLGLSTTDIIYNACEMIGINPDDIPLNDKKTEEMLAKGDSSNVFQLESSLAKHTLKEVGKGDIKTITELNSLIRPGCLKAKDSSGMTTYEKYIKYAKGELEPKYLIPELKNVLKDSPLILFQEDVLNILNKLGNFDLKTADLARRSLGKKIPEIIIQYKQKFIDGCKSNGISEYHAKEVFELITFSSLYIFNLNHSFCYSCISMMTAYLKANFPTQYWCATLSYTNKKDLIPSYIREIKKSGISIKPPDINLSEATEWKIIHEAIIAPLSICKYVGDKVALTITESRSKVGSWSSMDEFNQSMNECTKRPNKRAMSALYFCDVFKSIGHYEKDLERKANQQQTYLDIFSPLPYIKFKQINRNNEINDLYNDLYNCCNEDLIYWKGNIGNVMVIVDVTSSERELLQNNSWFPKHLSKTLKTTNIYFTSSIKCELQGRNKNNLSKNCKECGINTLQKEIEIIKPDLIICCTSPVSKILGKTKFMESFGSIQKSDKFDCYYINMPSPSFMSFKSEMKEEYKDKIFPLLKDLGEQNENN